MKHNWFEMSDAKDGSIDLTFYFDFNDFIGINISKEEADELADALMTMAHREDYSSSGSEMGCE